MDHREHYFNRPGIDPALLIPSLGGIEEMNEKMNGFSPSRLIWDEARRNQCLCLRSHMSQ